MKPNNLNTEQAKLNAQHASFPRDSCALGGSRSRRTAACVREMNATRRTLRPHSGGWYSEGERPPREQMQTQIRKFERCAHRKEALSPKTHLDSSVLLNFFCVCVFFPPSLLLGRDERRASPLITVKAVRREASARLTGDDAFTHPPAVSS